MSDRNGNRIHRPGDKMFATREEAEQLAHTAYALGRKEEAVERRKFALALEARIKGLEERIAALEPQPAATVSPL